MRAVVAGIGDGQREGYGGFPVKLSEHKRAKSCNQLIESGSLAGVKVKPIPNRIGHRIGDRICGYFLGLEAHFHSGDSCHPDQCVVIRISFSVILGFEEGNLSVFAAIVRLHNAHIRSTSTI